MSLDVAIKKLERKLLESPAGVQTLHQAENQPIASVPPMQTLELRKEGKGVELVVDSLKASSKIQWDQMKENVAVSQVLAQELCKLFGTDSLKKIKLIDKTTERSKVFHLIIYDREDGQTSDNKIALTLAASEALRAKPGDVIIAEAAGGGLFG